MAPKAKPKAKAEAKAEPKAKAEAAPKAVANAKPDAGSPAAGSGAAAVRQQRDPPGAAEAPSVAKEVPAAKSAPAKAPSAKAVAPAKAGAAKAGAKAAPKAAAAKADEEAAKAELEAKEAADEEQRKAEEEEHKRFDEMQKQEIQRKAEEEAKRKEKENGDVILKYSMYDEKFPIIAGNITASQIDEVYCLSDVMPGCVLHLSEKTVEEKYAIESSGETFPYVFEEPEGTFHGLQAGSTYYVYVTEDEAEFLKSQEKAKAAHSGTHADKVRGEGCSCLEGNPCMDEYVCTDWHNRFALARKNGWIGYQAF